MSGPTPVELAKKELKGFDKLYTGLLDKHNVLIKLEPCFCECAFCEDAGRRIDNKDRLLADLYECKACDELTDSDWYREHMERAEQLRAIIKAGV